MTEKNIPVGIIIIGIFAFLFMLREVRVGFGMILNPIDYGVFLGTGLVIVGIISGIFGVGCFMKWSWAWRFGVIFSIVGILLLLLSILIKVILLHLGMIFGEINIIELFDINIVELLGLSIVLWYLFRHPAKAYFGKIDP
jgi:hypothetical protein